MVAGDCGCWGHDPVTRDTINRYTAQRPDVARSIVHLTHHCHTDHSTHHSTATAADDDDDATDAAADIY